MSPAECAILEREFAAATETGENPQEVLARVQRTAPSIAPLLADMIAAHRRACDEESRSGKPTSATALRQLGGISDPGDDPPATFIGPYRILGVLGQGGSGMVYLAYEAPPLKRLVAVKVVHPAAATKDALRRFEFEQSTLARLSHANVVSAIASGDSADGLPYIVMPLVPGVPITDFAATESLDISARVRLLVQACSGVQHAHTNGVIHRDLKPGNILVAWGDAAPRAVVIDFGLAKPTSGPPAGVTMTGQAIGTPRFMSPEQRAGKPVDARTDVFSLGVILHELLRLHATSLDDGASEGRPPPSSASASGVVPDPTASPDDPRLTLTEPEFWPPPSRLAAGPIPRELDWISQRCLEADRDRRYSTVAALVEDLEAALQGGVVRAGPPARLYRAASWMRRRKLLVSSVATITALIVLSAAVSTWLAYQERAQRHRAELTAAFSSELLAGIDPEVAQGRDRELIISMLDSARARTTKLAADSDARAELDWMMGMAYHKLGEHALALPLLERADAVGEARRWPMDRRFDILEARIRSLSELEHFGEMSPLAVRLVQFAAVLETRNPEYVHRAEIIRVQSILNRSTEFLDLSERLSANLGDDNPLTIRATRLAARDLLRKQPQRALSLFIHARESAAAKFGDSHPLALEDLSAESWAIRRTQGFAAEKAFIVPRLEVAERVLGRLHRVAILLRTNLALDLTVEACGLERLASGAGARPAGQVRKNGATGPETGAAPTDAPTLIAEADHLLAIADAAAVQRAGVGDRVWEWVQVERVRCRVLAGRDAEAAAAAQKLAVIRASPYEMICDVISEGYEDLHDPEAAAMWQRDGVRRLSEPGPVR
jgi:non-specific serine/threonine protein kinase/serine/threonine-protein kinase